MKIEKERKKRGTGLGSNQWTSGPERIRLTTTPFSRRLKKWKWSLVNNREINKNFMYSQMCFFTFFLIYYSPILKKAGCIGDVTYPQTPTEAWTTKIWCWNWSVLASLCGYTSIFFLWKCEFWPKVAFQPGGAVELKLRPNYRSLFVINTC